MVRSPGHRMACAVLCVAVFAGCHSAPPVTQARIAGELQSRMGQSLGPCNVPGQLTFPAGVDLVDGLTEQEAVTLALWNNAAYHEALAQLGISGAQLYDAGLLTDPQFTVLFPLGPKQLEFFGFLALDAMWLRHVRVRAAELDLTRVADQLVQNGLDLIRDVRLAHSDLVFAQERAELAREAETIRIQIAELADRRLADGDISGLEANAARVEALRAQADAGRFAQDVVLARNRLRNLIGLSVHSDQIVAVRGPQTTLPDRPAPALVGEALAVRPDLRAAEIAIEAAAEREDLAKWAFMTLEAIFDANSEGFEGFETGPGVRFTVPIFNGNRGGRAIASAELHRAMRQYVTLRDRVALDVQTAHAEAEQAADNLEVVTSHILPRLDQAVTLATRNYTDGGATYFLVLETTGQFLDARARELELANALRRALANLDRSVGYRVAMMSPEAPPAAPPMDEGSAGPPSAPEADGDVVPALFQPGGQIQLRLRGDRARGVFSGAASVGKILSAP